jgi:hypothetical protein
MDFNKIEMTGGPTAETKSPQATITEDAYQTKPRLEVRSEPLRMY